MHGSLQDVHETYKSDFEALIDTSRSDFEFIIGTPI